MIDTADIRKQLLQITRKNTCKRMRVLVDDVMELCEEYDKVSSMPSFIQAGHDSLEQSFNMIETLRKSL